MFRVERLQVGPGCRQAGVNKDGSVGSFYNPEKALFPTGAVTSGGILTSKQVSRIN